MSRPAFAGSEDLSGGAGRGSRPRRLDSPNDVADVIEVRDVFAGDHVDGASSRPAAARFHEEIADPHGERVGDGGQAIEADVHMPAFDLSDVLRGALRAFREFFLAPAAQLAKLPNRRADAGANRASLISHDA